MRHRRLAKILGTGFFICGLPAWSEVAVDLGAVTPNTITFGAVIGDDSDPIGVWLQYRTLPASQILNPAGHARGDGRPDIAFKRVVNASDPVAFWPLAIWSYKVGSDHDIATAEWNGASWTPLEFLTSGSDDELDPRVFVESDGTAHAVWWSAGSNDGVFLSTRPAESTAWSPAIEVDQAGRRPSVAVHEGTLRVAFERSSSTPGMEQDVVVLRLAAGGLFVEEFVTSTSRIDRLDVQLHATGSKLWMDWKHGAGTFGSIEFGSSGWGAVEEPAWPDPSWIGVEQTRKAIATGVMNP